MSGDIRYAREVAEALRSAPTVEEVVAAWNGPQNAAVRKAVCPPRGRIGPFPVIGAGAGVTASPQGNYKVHVVVSQARAPMRGFDLRAADMYFGVNTDFGGAPLATHHSDGSLSLSTQHPPL